MQDISKNRVLFPIGAKLVIIISILLLVSLGAVTFIVSVLSTQDVQRTAEDNNYTVNRRAGSQAEGSFKSIQASVLLYLEMLEKSSFGRDSEMEMQRFFFNHNENIAAIGVEAARNALYTNEKFFQSHDIQLETVRAYFAEDLKSIYGNMRIYNASPYFLKTLLTAVFIREGKNGQETVKVLFFPDDLSESFGTGTNTSFLISDAADVLLHPDLDFVLGGANFSNNPIVGIMQK